ncbi:putative uncharacterized protein FLJ40606 [Sturnira hondurensis]|uniref:putative uncharacterized protein FLJ40606 n=1 Tax=Sturnira hondurensis TaxID=192404 RepID=UPI00187A6D14|nr:putative uncharacterized protein FLJ40606 [Sturnira hondurensis]
MAAAAETKQAVAPSGKHRRGHGHATSDSRILAGLAAGPWLPGALTCPKRTRGDAATRSARLSVLPPPPRPPQRRSRHLVSRAGTPHYACAGGRSPSLGLYPEFFTAVSCVRAACKSNLFP